MGPRRSQLAQGFAMKKFIKMPTQRSVADIARLIINHGSIAICSLPHYRYYNNRRNIRALERAGFVRYSGEAENAKNYAATPLLHEWHAQFIAGLTSMQPLNWKKHKQQEQGNDLI